jgi:hypothetical protein
MTTTVRSRGRPTTSDGLVARRTNACSFAANSASGTCFHGAASFAPKQKIVQSAGAATEAQIRAVRVSSADGECFDLVATSSQPQTELGGPS